MNNIRYVPGRFVKTLDVCRTLQPDGTYKETLVEGGYTVHEVDPSMRHLIKPYVRTPAEEQVLLEKQAEFEASEARWAARFAARQQREQEQQKKPE